ncbi:hypothetical protein BGX38DRAFT_1160200 [Terfezia claveryi]|nr:hypothetical protein BGX38DRAFT_1160200 [Terfezia claveryi]
MAPIITASTSTHISQPGTLSSHPKKKPLKSFKSKSGGLHNINLTFAHIDLSNPHLPQRDRQRLAQLEKTLPKLNGVVPAGISKARRGGVGNKGKRFVEDKESMFEILRLVNEVKEEKIEEKLEKGRQLEALREARRKEQDAREEQRKKKLEGAKDRVRRKRGNKLEAEEKVEEKKKFERNPKAASKKRVSFA